MIEQAEALGERPEGEDALLRFSVLYGQWTGNHSAGNLAKAARGGKAFPCGGGKATALCTIADGSPSDGSDPLSFRRVSEPPVDTWIKRLPFTDRRNTDHWRPDLVKILVSPRWVIDHYVLCRLGYPESALIDVDEALKLRARPRPSRYSLICH